VSSAARSWRQIDGDGREHDGEKLAPIEGDG
jgi:hypothetical protein